MKEATGELNMTVITVVAIAAVAALFYAFLWPSIKTSIQAQTICSYGQNYTVGTQGQADYVKCDSAATNGQYTCHYGVANDNGSVDTKDVTCKVK